MPYNNDPKATGFEAVKFHNRIPVHDLDSPAGHPESYDYPKVPSWTKELIRRRGKGKSIDPKLLPTGGGVRR